jgi:Kef-type K+ transport system membrane component KefB
MMRFKNLFFYITLIGGFSILMYWIFIFGSDLEVGREIKKHVVQSNYWNDFLSSLIHNLKHPLALLLAQIITIILTARLFGWICMKIGQPSVIGEIIAGIILGPSLLGLYFPDFFTTLFPKESLGNLQFLSQIGLILFMFVVGMELDLKVLRNKAHDAVVISHASIIFPFALGVGLAYFIYQTFAPQGVPFLAFGLFLGIAMSITAFPVLARIVQERGIHKTKLGAIVITCAAADDITAWCILAAVIAIVKAGSFVSALYIIALAAIYVLLMLKVVRPFLKRVGDLNATKEKMSKPIVAIFFLVLVMSAYATEIIGIHALFGAFMAGVIMPVNTKFRNVFIEKIEDVSLVLLLPLFFVFTGLRTQIGLLNDPYHWLITCFIVAVAVAGKFFGSAFAARFVGQSWKDSWSIGALMNTRGLMELVVLNIGYDLGVLTPEIFAMMVIMALLTTFMTGPALDFINWIFKEKNKDIPIEVTEISKYKVLISFNNPENGKSLLRLASGLVKKLQGNATVTAMHLAQTNELHHFNAVEYEKEIFAPVIEESAELNQKVTTFFKASVDIDSDITEVANKGDFDLLLIGIGESIFEGTLLGKVLGFTTKIISPDRIINTLSGKEKLFENSPFDEKTRQILSRSQVPVGILMDKKLQKLDAIFIPIFGREDEMLISYIQKFIHNSAAQITVLDANGYVANNPTLKEWIRFIEQNAPNHISLINQKKIESQFLKQQDLMLISIESWEKLIDSRSVWLNHAPSTLVLKN